MALLKNAVSIEESQRDVKKVNILLAIWITNKAQFRELSACLVSVLCRQRYLRPSIEEGKKGAPQLLKKRKM